MTRKKMVIMYVVSLVVGLGIMVLILNGQNFSFHWEQKRIFRVLCDATFVPGVLLTCFGLLMAISNEGLFVAFGYTWMRFTSSLGKDYKEKRRNMLSYKEYRDMKTARKAPSAFAWIPGCVFIAVSLVFLVLFYTC